MFSSLLFFFTLLITTFTHFSIFLRFFIFIFFYFFLKIYLWFRQVVYMVENLHTSLNPSSRLDISPAILLYLSLASKKVFHTFQLRPVHHWEYLSWCEIYGYLQLISCSPSVPSPFAALLELHWLLCWCIYNYSSWYHIFHLPFIFWYTYNH